MALFLSGASQHPESVMAGFLIYCEANLHRIPSSASDFTNTGYTANELWGAQRQREEKAVNDPSIRTDTVRYTTEGVYSRSDMGCATDVLLIIPTPDRVYWDAIEPYKPVIKPWHSAVNDTPARLRLIPSVRSSICSLLDFVLSRWQDNSMPRLAGNSTKTRDVIFIRSSLGIQLAQVSHASGSQLRMRILDSATIKCHFVCLNNERVFTRRNRKSTWQCCTLISQKTTNARRIVRGQFSMINETIPARIDYIHGIISTQRVWNSLDQ